MTMGKGTDNVCTHSCTVSRYNTAKLAIISSMHLCTRCLLICCHCFFVCSLYAEVPARRHAFFPPTRWTRTATVVGPALVVIERGFASFMYLPVSLVRLVHVDSVHLCGQLYQYNKKCTVDANHAEIHFSNSPFMFT